jgi:hypothetical protein
MRGSLVVRYGIVRFVIKVKWYGYKLCPLPFALRPSKALDEKANL